jgi:hypothetical protein
MSDAPIELVNILVKMHGYLTDGRVFLARELLEDLLENITGESYASTDTKSN